ncbi:hypothetical protein [Streptomyces sp. NPDC002088]
MLRASLRYDAIRPYALRDMFQRARFTDVDPTPRYPDYREWDPPLGS